MADTIQPFTTGMPTIPPQTQTNAEAPDIATSPSTEGLGGGIPLTSVQQPPEPHMTVAQHILSALGGANPQDPMSWAKSTIAGGLASAATGAASVGKTAPGQGWLTGAARGVTGVLAQQRANKQLALENQQKQQEMALKQKADARAEQELQIHMEDAKTQRAMWTAQTAASIQAAQQNAARFPTLQKEDQLRIKQLEDERLKSETDQLSILSAAGVNVADLEHVTSVGELTSSHAKQLGGGDLFPVQNGEEHKAGEDKAGAYLVPGDVWERGITKPVTITTGYEIDPKTGKATPKTTTAQVGTKVGTLLAIAKGAQTDLANKQNEVYKQAQLEHERAATEEARVQTEVARSNIQQGPQKDILGGTFTPPAGGVKETNKVRDSFKKDADSLAKTEGTFNQFQDVLNDINSGKPMTGAQSVVALFNAIGISAEPLQGKGFRINHSTVEEHENARGLGEGLYQKLLKLKEGDVITPQQVKDYADIAMRSRHDAYVNKINEVRSQGVNPDFLLPRGNGRKIDANTATIFYDSAAGNSPQEKSANAQKAAQATGWTF